MPPPESNRNTDTEGVTPPALRLRLATHDEDSPSPPDEEALAAFRRAAWLNPEEADYHYILAEALLRAGRLTEAAAAFEEATWRSATEAPYHVGLGLALHGLRRHVEAASAFREAVRLAPRDALAHGGLGASLMAMGQAAEGLRSLGQAVVLAPAGADAQFNLGIAFVGVGRPEDALTPLRKATTLRPGDVVAHVELGGVLHGLGRHQEAHAAFGEALRIDSRCLEALPHWKAAHDSSAVAVLKEGMRGDLAAAGSPSRLLLRPVVAVVERLPDLPRGLAAALSVASLVVATYVTARLVPPYWSHYALKDDIAVIGHAAVRDDTQIRARVMEAAERHHLERYVQQGQLTIETRRTWRRITCSYRVPVALLPGFTPQLRFSLDVEEPVLIDGEEKIFF